MTKEQLKKEIAIYKNKMDLARIKKHFKAFNDLKKHYDKLLKELKKYE